MRGCILTVCCLVSLIGASGAMAQETNCRKLGKSQEQIGKLSENHLKKKASLEKAIGRFNKKIAGVSSLLDGASDKKAAALARKIQKLQSKQERATGRRQKSIDTIQEKIDSLSALISACADNSDVVAPEIEQEQANLQTPGTLQPSFQNARVTYLYRTYNKLYFRISTPFAAYTVVQVNGERVYLTTNNHPRALEGAGYVAVYPRTDYVEIKLSDLSAEIESGDTFEVCLPGRRPTCTRQMIVRNLAALVCGEFGAKVNHQNQWGFNCTKSLPQVFGGRGWWTSWDRVTKQFIPSPNSRLDNETKANLICEWYQSSVNVQNQWGFNCKQQIREFGGRGWWLSWKDTGEYLLPFIYQ